MNVSTIDTVRELKRRSREHRDNASKLDAAVDALQAVCDHDWKETGYDPRGSSTTYYECPLCGAEKRV